MNLVAHVIGLVLLIVWLGVLVWAIAALPFTVIVVFVVGLLAFDFVRNLREGENGADS